MKMVGGTVKQLAARASLQWNFRDQFMTALTRKNVNVSLCLYQLLITQQKGRFLSDRFSRVNSISGTQKLQTFLPIKRGVLHTKCYSYSSECLQHCVSPFNQIMFDLDNI